MASSSETTQLLAAWSRGDRGALDRLMAVVYPALRLKAQAQLGRDRDAHTLQPTALVHEVYLRLIDVDRIGWKDRAHFLAVAAQLMRQILLDSARRHRAQKRGGGRRVPLTGIVVSGEERPIDVLALDDALRELAELDPDKSRIVELRFFGGMTVEETAEVMGISPRTVKRGWQAARVWLHRELAVATPSATTVDPEE